MNNTARFLFLPLAFLKFWYFESVINLFGFFASLNKAFFQLFSLWLLIKTFFKPLKNEYRQGLVGFSIVMGMIIKSMFIFVDLLLLVALLAFEIVVIISFLVFPVATFLILFY